MPIYKTLAYLVVLWNLSNEFCVEKGISKGKIQLLLEAAGQNIKAIVFVFRDLMINLHVIEMFFYIPVLPHMIHPPKVLSEIFVNLTL